MRFRLLITLAAMITLTCICASADPKRESPPCGNYGTLRVSFMTAEGMLVHRVEPEYPTLGRNMRVQGEVSLYVQVDKKGAVEQMCMLSGHPLLVGAAMDAVRQWRWKPFLLNGKPRKIEFPVSVQFKLK